MKTQTIRPGLAMGLFSVLLAVLVVIMFPVQAGGGRSKNSSCLSNLKQVGVGHLIYAADYDDRFAPTDWVPALDPYTKRREIYRCPFVESGDSGYAYNRNLAGQKLPKAADPARIALTFEVDDLHLGALADRVSPLTSARHGEKLAIIYADSHARFIPFDIAPTVRTQLKSGAVAVR